MARYEHSIDVRVPIDTVYSQWAKFEDFPFFMDGVKEVRQVTDHQLFWRTEIEGVEQEWYAEITEQTPNERIAWTSRTGAKQAGVVTFTIVDPNTTHISLQIDYEPDGFIENVGEALSVVEHRNVDDLKRFKAFIETRSETSARREQNERPAALFSKYRQQRGWRSYDDAVNG